MSAPFLSLKTGLVATVLAAGAVGASVGPDSITKNVGERLVAGKAMGRLVQLSDSNPVGNRYPIVDVLGMNNSDDPKGPSESDIRMTLDFQWRDCSEIYYVIIGRPMAEDAVWFGYAYNSDLSDPVIVQGLHDSLEGHPYFTQADGYYSVICYSKGGNIMREYWTGEGDRKMETVFASGSPQRGTPTIDKPVVIEGIKLAHPKSGKTTVKVLEWLDYLGVDFDSEGSRWLREDCQERDALFASKPLTGDWYLAGGTIDVSDANAITRGLDVGLTFDKWFASATGSGAQQDDGYYRFMALALSKQGYMFTDGVAPLGSVLDGKKGEAHCFVLPEHNHSQMINGNGGTELHELMVRCLIPRILAHRDKRLRSFDVSLPEMPVVMLFPIDQSELIAKARVVGLDEQRQVVVVDGGKLKSLQLPAGEYNYPQWWGDGQLIASWYHDGVSDIIVIRDKQQIANLTNNGKSDFPAIQADGMLATFVSNGDLMVRSVGGMAQVVVKGPVKLVAPPIFLGDKIYFLHQQAEGRFELRWVQAYKKAVSLSSTKLVADNVVSWTKVGSGLLAFQETANGLKPIPVVSGFGAVLDVDVALGVKALHSIQGLPKISEIAVAGDGTIYVGWDNQLHRLDMTCLPTETINRLEEARRRLAGESPTEMKQVGIDQLLPLEAEGIYQIDAK